MAADPFVYPGTNTLRNLYGIQDPDVLADVEDRLTTARLIVVDALGVPGTFDLKHLQAFHKVIFGDLYEWAGELRTVDISKGQFFGLHQRIAGYLGERLARVRTENYLRGLPRDQVLDRLTYYLAEINAAHPFREGNGRAQRAYTRQLARRAGWELDWRDLDPAENIRVSIESFNGDNAPLRRLLEQRLTPLSADAPLLQPEHLAQARTEFLAAQELVDQASPAIDDAAGAGGAAEAQPGRSSSTGPDRGSDRDR